MNNCVILFILQNVLSVQFVHIVDSVTTVDTGFEAYIHVDVAAEDSLDEWWQSFRQTSKTTFRVCRTFPDCGRKVIFKVCDTLQCNESKRPHAYCILVSYSCIVFFDNLTAARPNLKVCFHSRKLNMFCLSVLTYCVLLIDELIQTITCYRAFCHM